MHAKCETEARCGVCRLLITTQEVSCEGGLRDRLEWVNPCTSIWYGWWASAFAQCGGLFPDKAVLLSLLPANPQ